MDDDIFGEAQEYDYEDGNDDADIFRAEVKAFERAGPGGDYIPMADKDGKREANTPEARFRVFLDAQCRKIMADGEANLTNKDIENMLQKSTIVTNLKWRNPTAYLLGYLASQGGTSLKPEVFNRVIKNVMPIVGEQAGIQPEDVLRYARYWVRYL